MKKQTTGTPNPMHAAQERAKKKGRPLLDMHPAEMNAVFDELGLENNFGLLQNARRGGSPAVVAVAFLRGPDHEGGVAVLRELEEGDGVGIECIDEFIAEIQRVGLLLPQETIYRKVLQVVDAEEVPADRVAELEAIIAHRVEVEAEVRAKLKKRRK